MVAGQIRKCVVEPDASITDVSSDSAFECGSYFGELEHLTVSHGALNIILLYICFMQNDHSSMGGVRVLLTMVYHFEASQIDHTLPAQQSSRNSVYASLVFRLMSPSR